ncbi:hypothetical protein [Nocardia sp. NPDC051570]|uniref:hypothetical protein n=1 Tax=Nocardia sp. NPDC051570 TaxID=3364324 RepID=UPI00379CED37
MSDIFSVRNEDTARSIDQPLSRYLNWSLHLFIPEVRFLPEGDTGRDGKQRNSRGDDANPLEKGCATVCFHVDDIIIGISLRSVI